MWARSRAVPVDARLLASPARDAPATAWRTVGRHVLVHGLCLATAAGALAAYEHLKLQGAPAASLVALGTAVVLGLWPLRALARGLLALEGTLLHLVHGIAGLAAMGLTLGGVVSGRPVLDRVSLAPFAIMGAAQSWTHQPRSPEQAAALRRFVASVPEVRRVASAGAPASPAELRRSIAVVADVVAKAQALGETELRSDPAFQGALRRTTLRWGVSLALDSADEAVARLATNPAAAGAVPDLRRRLSAARRALDATAAPAPGGAPVGRDAERGGVTPAARRDRAGTR